MQRFQRKPEEIMAQQFDPDGHWPPGVRHPGAHGKYVVTINGSELEVLPGDWITYTEAGFGVCRDGYFRRMYEPVE